MASGGIGSTCGGRAPGQQITPTIKCDDKESSPAAVSDRSLGADTDYDAVAEANGTKFTICISFSLSAGLLSLKQLTDEGDTLFYSKSANAEKWSAKCNELD